MSSRGAQVCFLMDHLVIYRDRQPADRFSNKRIDIARAIGADPRHEFRADPLNIVGWLRTLVALTMRTRVLAALSLPPSLKSSTAA